MSRYANGDSMEYWKAAQEGRLIFQKCASCGEIQFPPRHHCASCWEADLGWTESSGLGEVESYTIVRRAPLPQLRDKVPYVVAAILVEEGPRMLTNLVGEDALNVAIGAKVKVVFQTDADDETLPQFQLA
ncbi:Zn-ribbon domain-containing OB-fold protein [Celeribacter sp. PS-C1]|nr:Zn-ribbon domain-containing OB-fold protein [Celeribacter sp. PS-C1]